MHVTFRLKQGEKNIQPPRPRIEPPDYQSSALPLSYHSGWISFSSLLLCWRTNLNNFNSKELCLLIHQENLAFIRNTSQIFQFIRMLLSCKPKKSCGVIIFISNEKLHVSTKVNVWKEYLRNILHLLRTDVFRLRNSNHMTCKMTGHHFN